MIDGSRFTLAPATLLFYSAAGGTDSDGLVPSRGTLHQGFLDNVLSPVDGPAACDVANYIVAGLTLMDHTGAPWGTDFQK